MELPPFSLLAGLALCAMDAVAADWSTSGGFTAIAQSARDSAVHEELSASIDLFLERSTSAGAWLLYVEGSTTPRSGGVATLYPSFNADSGTALTDNDSGRVQISELNYTFVNDNRRLMLGLIDPSGWLDRSRITDDENEFFLNTRLVDDATVARPDYSLGMVYEREPSVGPAFTLLVAGASGLADSVDRSYGDLIDQQPGVFTAASLRWQTEGIIVRTGVWYSSADQPVGDDPGDEAVTFGVYGVLSAHRGRNRWNLRVGAADDRVSPAARFLSAAFVREVRVGAIGVGVARTYLSHRFDDGSLDDTTDAELFWRIPLPGASAHLTPSIQYVEQPAFAVAERGAESPGVAASLRLRWTF